ncbi:hypothetical protein NDU88_001899 [Pleurodeles waltl]|uniref:Uncharacterized protein n=1 Tax=Pleurodeles waltl TaxID=8319 RepID=A0AAV7P8G4_PLEWA|nr:hypothetical protein NDU88_001899 [Pleurodeles waltl]
MVEPEKGADLSADRITGAQVDKDKGYTQEIATAMIFIHEKEEVVEADLNNGGRRNHVQDCRQDKEKSVLHPTPSIESLDPVVDTVRVRLQLPEMIISLTKKEIKGLMRREKIMLWELARVII